MLRKCSSCGKRFTSRELAAEESAGLEADRKAARLKGVRFDFYVCAICGAADIFVEVRPLKGESGGSFRRRRDDLAAAVRELHGAEKGVGVVLLAK
jgi:hypothetical protein